MPVNVRWGDANLTVLHYTVSGDWTWEEFYTAIGQGRQMREQRGAGGVRVIFEFSGTRHAPGGALSHFANLFKRGAANNHKVEQIFIVKPGNFLTAIGNVLQKLNPDLLSKVVIVETSDEAYALLAELQAQ